VNGREDSLWAPRAGAADESVPLAERLRPRSLDEVVGQGHLIGPGKILRTLIERDTVPSMVFWGPPGVGKTTLANVIARTTHSKFITFSAVTSGIKEIKEVMREADEARAYGQRTIVFVDEIHRFNKAQQDAFLPFVEKGSIILIGATTENPSFEVNGALLSRCKVFVLKGLGEDDLVALLRRALEDPRGFGARKVEMDGDGVRAVAVFANGDARAALSTLEMAVLNGEETEGGGVRVTAETVAQCTSRESLLYDKGGEEHYNIISALHKSMRNSDPDAAVYWLARMLEGGEDPLYVARRVTRFAAEDVGLADPRALELAVAAQQACHFIGMPECTVHLAEAVIYLSVAPKSNAAYMAYEHAKRDAMERMAEPVPLVIRNAPTRLMKDLGYGKGYRLAHYEENKIADMECLPEGLAGTEYYVPTEEGVEARVKARLAQIKAWKAELKRRRGGGGSEGSGGERN
jgi:putative ATPase